MTLTVYGQAQSRAVRALWMVEELGIPYTHVPTRFADEAKGAEFRAVNPNGRVPTIDDDGFVVFESMAINLYLAKRYGGPLAPRDLKEDALATQWSFWVMTEVEKTLLQALFHRTGFMGMERSEAKALEYLAQLDRPLRVLEGALVEREHLLGARFTVADLNVASVFAWASMAGLDLAPYPHVGAWLTRCLARPALARANAR
ncbi:MAG: Disulfide-bond oxidoreductase YfcG [Pseudomonadota bacterium]|jgi:glutathione S-transferase